MERYEVRALRDMLTQIFNTATDDDFKERFSVNIGNCVYDTDRATFKVTLVDKTATGGVEDVNALEFRRRAFQYGFEPSDLGKRFFYKGQFYEISGLKGKSHRSPILVKRVITGQMYRMPEDLVLACLKTSKRKEVVKG